jgi:hypothetical protein
MGIALVSTLGLLLLGDPDPRFRFPSWVVHYDAPSRSTDEARAGAADPQGNVYVTGSSSRSGSSGYLTVKYDAAGTELWVAGPMGDGRSTAITADSSGKSWVTGESWGTGVDTMTVAYDPEGRQLWQAVYSGDSTAESRPFQIAADPAGNVYVGGTVLYPDDDFEYVIVKYDPSGLKCWEARQTGRVRDWGLHNAIAIDSQGNVLLALGTRLAKYDDQGNEIWTWSAPTGFLGALTTDAAGNIVATGSSTVKYDPDGHVLWSVPEEAATWSVQVALDLAGNIVVAGSTILEKYDPQGARLWQRSHGETRQLDLISLAVDARASIFISTQGWFDRGSPLDTATLKFDEDGNLLWSVRYDGSDDQAVIAGMVVDGAGKVHVAGTSHGDETGEDYATVTYNSDGKDLWSTRYDGPSHGSETASHVALDHDGNIYVTQESQVVTGYVFRIVKYDARGHETWVRQVYDWVWDLAVDEKGHLYTLGESTLSRYDPQGSLLWTARRDAPGLDQFHAAYMALEATGGIYVTSAAQRADGCDSISTIKYDPDGNQRWSALFPRGGWPSALAVDRSGNALVVMGGLTVKYSSEGSEVWRRAYQGPSLWSFLGEAVGLDCAGNVYVAGHFDVLVQVNPSLTTTRSQLGLIKYSPDGKELWVVQSEDPFDVHVDATAVDCAGNSHLLCTLRGDGEVLDQLILKLDADGNEIWRARFGGPATYDSFSKDSLALDMAGNVYINRTVGLPGAISEIGTLKYSPGGEFLWEGRYRPDDSPRAWARSMAVDRFGNVLVAGQAWSDATSNDAIILKYSTDLTSFVRGDCDGNGKVAMADPISLLRTLFAGAGEPPCLSACDANGDGDPRGFLSDAIYLLHYLFLRGEPPPPPFPACEGDSAGALGCRTFTSC